GGRERSDAQKRKLAGARETKTAQQEEGMGTSGAEPRKAEGRQKPCDAANWRPVPSTSRDMVPAGAPRGHKRDRADASLSSSSKPTPKKKPQKSYRDAMTGIKMAIIRQEHPRVKIKVDEADRIERDLEISISRM